MKALCCLILLAVLSAAYSPVHGQNGTTDIVYLKNGSIIRGVIIELVPGSMIKIRTSDGSIFVYELEDVDKIEKSFSNVRRHNPYALHRQISGWGLISTMGITFVGSLAMNDEFFATTIIPIVGPFVTIARIENNPRSYYQPGGKPLLIAAGVAQVGFLSYYVISWAKGKSYNAKFSVLPSSQSFGIAMRYQF
jgi:hypothetical protein